MKFHRILVLADPAFGSASLSSQAAVALEDAGHGVTFMTVRQSPWLFEPADEETGAHFESASETANAHRRSLRVREGMLKPFLEKSRPSLVLLFDGIALSGADLEAAKECQTTVAIAGSGQDPNAEFSLEAIEAGVYRASFALAFANSHRDTQLANFIACGLCAVCCDAPDDSSIDGARALRDALAQADTPVRMVGIGQGWPDDLRFDCGPESLVYAARNAAACVTFDACHGPNADRSTAANCDPAANREHSTNRELAVYSACLAEGAPLVLADPADPESIEAAARAISEACARTPRPTEWSQPEEKRPSLLNAPSLNEQTKRLIETLETADVLADGFDEPAKNVCLCGYYGVGNFGDEMIAEHLAQSLQRKHGLVNVRAICAIAPKAWKLHGIETMELGDHVHVAKAVESSQALLITAGLLFDQGIRWTPGLASLLAPAFATDLPGLAHLCVLAQACGTPAFFYGTGDGPLNVEAGRRCMQVAGMAGARFFTRNEHSERLLLDCGVPAENVAFAADTLFELETPDQAPARAWAQEHGASLDAPIVVVALRDWPGLPADWTGTVARQFDRLADVHGCRFLFMEFDPADAGVHDAVAERMQRKDAILRYGAIVDYEEALSLLGCAWGGFAMRLHCSLIMACFGKPSVGIGYLPKVEALFTELGIGELLVPLSFSEQQLATALDNLAQDHEDMRAKVEQAVRREKDRLTVATEAVAEALSAPAKRPERRYWTTDRTVFQDAKERQTQLEGLVAQSNEHIARLQKALDEANDHAHALESSRSYRFGHAIMRIPHAVKSALRR